MKNLLLWLLAIALSLASMVYQRLTGPTHPLRGKIQVEESLIKFKFIRSHDVGMDAPVSIVVEDPEINGTFIYKRFKSHDEWTSVPMTREGNKLIAAVPHQPAAGKVMYKVVLDKNEKTYELTKKPVIIRFKGSVPAWALTPHVLFMILAMIFSTRAGIEALAYRRKTFQYSLITLITLVLGGLVLGPIVQKFAFDAYWTGWPFGTDLTDNKTAISVLFWVIAVIKTKQDCGNRFWPILAAIVLFAIYLVPHSMFGSELDFTAEMMNP